MKWFCVVLFFWVSLSFGVRGVFAAGQEGVLGVGKGEVAPKGVRMDEVLAEQEREFLEQKRLVRPVVGGGGMMKQAGQFLVFGGDGALQGSLALRAEEEKAALRKLIPFDDHWKVPIWIHLFGKVGDVVPAQTCSYGLEQSEAGFVLRLNLHLGQGVNDGEFRKGIVTLLLYEQALRGVSVTGGDELELHVPVWLTVGLDEAIAWQQQRGDRRLYETLFQRGGLFALRDLLKVTDLGEMGMDGATREAFRGSSGALVMALLSQSDGRDGFVQFLKRVANFQGEQPSLLRECFPDLNLSEKSLAKWWQLQMMTMATAKITDTMSVAETEVGLRDALRLQVKDVSGVMGVVDLGSWERLRGGTLGERRYATRVAEEQLVRMSYRCFPAYRGLLVDYQKFLRLLSGKEFLTSKDEVFWRQKLLDLRKMRDGMVMKGERARDYLNWFEITRAREISGQFDDYMRLKRRLEMYPAMRRGDRVSVYLERMDRIFYRKGQRRGSLAAASGVVAPSLLSTELPEELREKDVTGVPLSDAVLPLPDGVGDSVTPLPLGRDVVPLPLNPSQIPQE